MSCSVRYSCPNAITTLSTRIPLFFFTAIASGRLSSWPVVKLLSTEPSGRGQAVAGRDAEAESVRASPVSEGPMRHTGAAVAGVELRSGPALQLAEMPPGVHEREIGQGHVRPDAEHFLGEPEREGVVVAGGDQDAVRLHRLEHVDGEVARQVLVGAGGAGVIAASGTSATRKTGVAYAHRFASVRRGASDSAMPR